MAFGLALAGSAVLGAVAGLIWSAVAPTPLLQEIAQGEAQLVNVESSAFIVADAWFVGITALAGLVTGVLGWRLLVRRAGPAAVAGLVLGAAAAALVAMWVGDNIGLSSYHHLLATSAVNSYFHGSLALGAKSALGIWALCTSGVILVAESGARRPAGGAAREEAREEAREAASEPAGEEGPSGMWTGEPPQAHAP